MWIGGGYEDDYKVGQIGFLIETSPQDRASWYTLSYHPAHTNQSHEPKLYGWCGSYNNTSTNARGLVKVLKVAKNGRAMVAGLTVEEQQAALEELGYPDLAA
jgi:hypothetical protein